MSIRTSTSTSTGLLQNSFIRPSQCFRQCGDHHSGPFPGLSVLQSPGITILILFFFFRMSSSSGGSSSGSRM